eukprot:c43724_g1_i1 orf=1161-1994(-)
MYNRFGLDRFKKAQSEEPFSVDAGSLVVLDAHTPSPVQAKPSSYSGIQSNTQILQWSSASVSSEATAGQATCIGNGLSTWQPPDWAIDPRPGTFSLEVVKDGEVMDNIALDKRRHIFGRQAVMCDFVLDHASVSRQHAAVVQHKNGSIYVIDLGTVHGTFVANERLTKNNPVELEVGQSLRFAASSRSYILRKNVQQMPQISQQSADFVLPPRPDPSDEEAVLVYNTRLNQLNLFDHNDHVDPVSLAIGEDSRNKEGELQLEKPLRKLRRSRVTFRD